MSSTMPEQTPFRCPELSCRKKSTSDSWQLKHIKLHYPEHLQVARQKNLTICSAPQCVEPAQHHEFNANKELVKDLDAFPYLKQVENIPDSESQSPPPPLPQMDIYPGAGAPLIDYIAEPWERDAQDCLDISKMYFSHWEPPGVFERRRSVNLEVSISGKDQTLGGHSGRPSE